MQFQSDMAGIPVQVPEAEELSGIGAAYAAGIGLGIYEKEELFVKIKRTAFTPRMENGLVDKKYIGWKNAVDMFLKNKVYSRQTGCAPFGRAPFAAVQSIDSVSGYYSVFRLHSSKSMYTDCKNRICALKNILFAK